MSQTRRGHLPYGYKIENGIAVVCEEEAAQLRKMYEGYLGGLSLMEAAAQVGQSRTHASVKRIPITWGMSFTRRSSTRRPLMPLRQNAYDGKRLWGGMIGRKKHQIRSQHRPPSE